MKHMVTQQLIINLEETGAKMETLNNADEEHSAIPRKQTVPEKETIANHSNHANPTEETDVPKESPAKPQASLLGWDDYTFENAEEGVAAISGTQTPESLKDMLQVQCLNTNTYTCDGWEWSFAIDACLELGYDYPCSCEEGCYDSYPPCCIRRLADDARRKLQVPTPQCYAPVLGPLPNTTEMDFYIMRDSCNADWPEDEVSRKCQNVSEDDIESQWPVVSTVSDVVYTNEHCALCNWEDASHLVKWNLVASCRQPTVFENSTFLNLDNFVKQIYDTPKCYLKFVYPEGTRYEICQQYSPPWGDLCPPHLLTSSLHNFPVSWLFPDTCQSLFVYAAINVSLDHLVSSLCAAAFDRYECSGGHIDTPFPFVLVISADALSDVTRASAENHCRCGEGEVYDEYESRCRELTCNQMRRLEKGTCVPFADSALGVGYQLSFHLVPVDVVEKPLHLAPENYLRLVVKEIYNAFIDKNPEYVLGSLFYVFRLVMRTERLTRYNRMLGQDVFLRNFTLTVRFITNTVMNSTDLETTLMSFSRSEWKVLSVMEPSSAFTLKAIPAYVDVTELHYETTAPSPVYSNVIPGTSVESNTFSEHTIDIANDISFTHQIVTEYNLVQHTLDCPKVSFKLSDEAQPPDHSSVQGDNRGNNQPNSDSSTHNPTAVSFTTHGPHITGAERRGNGFDTATDSPWNTDNNARGFTAASSTQGVQGTEADREVDNTAQPDKPRPRTPRMLRSVDTVSGKVVLTLDRETGSVYHVPSGRLVPFEYVEVVEGGAMVRVCADRLFGKDRPALSLEHLFSPELVYLSLGCQSLSVVCLFLVLLTYGLFPELRTLPGKNTMGLVASLLLAMLLFELGVARVELLLVCTVLGVATHFCLLSSFTWMVLCSAHMYRVFTSILSSRSILPDEGSAQFRRHLAISLALPTVVVALTLVANWLANRGECGLDLGYGRGVCYLSNVWSLALASVLPICLAVTANLGLFAATLRSLRSLNADLVFATQSQRQQLAVYVRMSTLTGVNWVAGLLTAVVDSVVLWYVFIVLCGLQGVYVFAAFVCTRRVVALYRNLFFGKPKDAEVGPERDPTP